MNRQRTKRLELPCGLWSEGQRWRRARLREPRGIDEAFLAERAGAGAPASVANGLLARCLETLGPHESVGPAEVQALAVGDRDALLLHLRRLANGNRIDSTVACPAEECGAKLDVTLAVDDLLQPAYEARPEHELDVEVGTTTFAVRCRRPTVGDVEAVAREQSSQGAASRRLLHRCIETVEGPEGKPVEPDDWPAEFVAAASDRLADLDPQAELQLETTCPTCETGFGCLFDPASYLLTELASGTDVYREVHHLALYYNWSEAEILGLTRRRRRRYLDLLDRSLGTGGAR